MGTREEDEEGTKDPEGDEEAKGGEKRGGVKRGEGWTGGGAPWHEKACA